MVQPGDDSPALLARAWLRAVNEPSIVDALEGVYAHIARETALRGPACWASGRCCNFDAAGHRLYVTGLETAYAVARLSLLPFPPLSPLPTSQASPPSASPSSAVSPPPPPRRPAFSLPLLNEARARGGCPFQLDNLCGIHAVKPLGCRVYFCDRTAQQWQQDLTEAALAEIRAIHDRSEIPYRYGEWRDLLAWFAGPDPRD